MDQITHEMRMEHWKQIITQCQSRPEGQSAKQWMRENGISDKSYYYWQRRIRQEAYAEIKSASPLVAVPTRPANDEISFAEITPEVQPESNRESVEKPDAIIKTANCSIVISNSISPALRQSITEVCCDIQPVRNSKAQ